MRFKILILLILLTKLLYTQDLELNNTTKFKDGVYLSYEEFLTNSPSLKLNYISYIKVKRISKHDNFRGRSLSNNTTLKLACSADSLWGICIDGKPHIMIGQAKHDKKYYSKGGEKINDKKYNVYLFAKLIFKGHLCYYFIAIHSVDNPLVQSQFSGANGSNNVDMSIEQYILKVSTGERLKFNSSNLLKLITDDKELFKKFKELSMKKKKKEKFNIFREYNERNPILLSK